jgi:hypothetical protein
MFAVVLKVHAKWDRKNARKEGEGGGGGIHVQWSSSSFPVYESHFKELTRDKLMHLGHNEATLREESKCLWISHWKKYMNANTSRYYASSAITQAVGRRLSTTAARLLSQVRSCWMCRTKWHWDRFSSYIYISLGNSHSTDCSTAINHPITRPYIASILTPSLNNKLKKYTVEIWTQKVIYTTKQTHLLWKRKDIKIFSYSDWSSIFIQLRIIVTIAHMMVLDWTYVYRSCSANFVVNKQTLTKHSYLFE